MLIGSARGRNRIEIDKQRRIAMLCFDPVATVITASSSCGKSTWQIHVLFENGCNMSCIKGGIVKIVCHIIRYTEIGLNRMVQWDDPHKMVYICRKSRQSLMNWFSYPLIIIVFFTSIISLATSPRPRYRNIFTLQYEVALLEVVELLVYASESRSLEAKR